MKISKKLLEKIIREEVGKVTETPYLGGDPDLEDPSALSGAKGFEEELGNAIKQILTDGGLNDVLGKMPAAYDLSLPEGAIEGLADGISQVAAAAAVKLVADASQKQDAPATTIGYPSLTRGVDPKTGQPRKPFKHDPSAKWPESRGLKHHDRFTKDEPGL